MTVAELRALTAHKPAGKGKTSAASPEPRSAAVIAKEQAARLAVVGPARLAWTNTTFGVALFCRKYQVADEAQAAALDKEFHRVTNTQPV